MSFIFLLNLFLQKNLENLAKQFNHLIIWTDCDREGENIGHEIVTVIQSVNPSITVYRAIFSEITKPSICRAIRTLSTLDLNKSNAVIARRQIDLKVGAIFTRYLTLSLRKKYPQHLNKCLVSYGMCQFPTLGFVVRRYKEIQKFVSEDFFKITVHHRKGSVNTAFNWSRGYIFSKQITAAILNKLKHSKKYLKRILPFFKVKYFFCRVVFFLKLKFLKTSFGINLDFFGLIFYKMPAEKMNRNNHIYLFFKKTQRTGQ